MLQNIIVIAVLAVAVFFLVRHFVKGGCSCCKSDGENKDSSCGCSTKK